MTKDEALKLALEALEDYKYAEARTIIREALAQPEQETPKGWKPEVWKSVSQTEQDGECKYCTDGCPACDARRQSNVLP